MLALALFLTDALADCAGGGLSVWPPPGRALASGGEILLEADGSEQARASSLRTHGGATLISDGKVVPLQVIMDLTGSFERTQVVLRPSVALPEGSRWTLAIDGEPLELYYGGKRQRVSWTIGPAPTS